MLDELVERVFPGAGLLAIGVVIGTAFSKELRPVAKDAIKFGMVAGAAVQTAAAEAYEKGQDLIAEARHEHEQEQAARAKAAAGEAEGRAPRGRRSPTVVEG